MRKHIWTLAALSVLVLAALAPVALAHHGHDDGAASSDDRDQEDHESRMARDNETDEREHEDQRDNHDGEHDARDFGHSHKHGPKSAFVLNLTGSGVGEDNATYTLTLDSSGKDVERFVNGSLVGIAGMGNLHVVVTGANGTIVKERDLRVRLVVRDVNGTATWTLVSKARQWDWEPRLALHGTAVKTATGLDLKGTGHAAFKASQVGPLRLQLTVSGTLKVPLSPPAPKPMATSSSSSSSS